MGISTVIYYPCNINLVSAKYLHIKEGVFVPRNNLFETLGTMVDMQRHFTGPTLVELRDGDIPNPRDRIEKIAVNWANNNGMSSMGGNSNIFVKEKGRIKTLNMSGVTAHYLRSSDQDHGSFVVAIYPFGIEAVTDRRQPIFQDPSTSRMRAVVLELPLADRELHWLQKPVEPLFNIDEDGTVLARFSEQPTPTELQLLQDILEQFEVNS